MPIKKCTKNGESGWSWGNNECYIGPDAKKKAVKQALAIGKGKMPKDIDEINFDDMDEKQLNNYVEQSEIKQDQILTNLHLDAFDSTKQLLITNVTRTNEGYLKGRAIVTNTGIFNYLVNGKVVKELRDNDEVFKSESLESLKNKPITDGHPKEMVTSENIKKLQVGFTGSFVQEDGHAVSIDFTITDKEMIQKIERGEKRAFSCGYSANLDYDVAGKYFFGNNPVDCRQKDIMYNHVAVVERGRAGDLAQLPININDGMDNVHTQIIEDTNEEAIMNQKLKIDGIDYEVDKDVAKYVHSLTTKIDESTQSINDLQTKLSDAEAKRDAFENEIKTLKEDAEKSKLTDAEIQIKVKERLALEKVADSAKVKFDDNTSNKEIKIAVIKTKNDKFDDTDKNDIYIDAYFDAVKNTIVKDTEEKPANENKKKVFGDNLNNNNIPEKRDSSKQKMYDEYKQRIIKESQEYKGAVSVQ